MPGRRGEGGCLGWFMANGLLDGCPVQAFVNVLVEGCIVPWDPLTADRAHNCVVAMMILHRRTFPM